MTTEQNKQWVFASHPSPNASVSNFRLENVEVPVPGEGELLLRLLYVSVDPYMRGRMNPGKSYFPGFQIDQPCDGSAVAEVVQTKSSKYEVGDLVSGFFPWKLYQVAKETAQLRKLPGDLNSQASHFLGALGMPGASALLPIEKFGDVKKGETAFVSGAAGAVGVVAVQVLKSLGAKVYGSAGTDAKVRYLIDELGLDGAFNYKTTDIDKALKEHVSQGVDIFFDNVGGQTFDTLLGHMNKYGRIIACGSISGYDTPVEQQYGVKSIFNITTRSLRIYGFLLGDFGAEVGPACARLAQLHRDGKLKAKETVVDGFENIPQAFMGLFTGINDGKLVVRVSKL